MADCGGMPQVDQVCDIKGEKALKDTVYVVAQATQGRIICSEGQVDGWMV